MKKTVGFFLILLKRYQMNFFWLLIFICGITACGKDLTSSDYRGIIGKYRLVYYLRYTSSTYEKINPTDIYEIEFQKNGKVHKIKNGHSESKDKVEDCSIISGSTSTYRDVYLHLKSRSDAVNMQLPLISGSNDTLKISGYYPLENDPNFSPYYYGHYYVKE
jgi:hypothetical protein